LRTGDGLNAEVPLLDDVESVECSYYGTAQPPMEPRPPLGTASCLFDEAGASRLPALPSAGQSWVELPLAMFRDGPFCGSGGMQYDADLLRVRRVVVRVRVRAVRSAWGAGVVSTPLARLGDTREVIIDASIRNLDGH
jgi:hypothetical protein